MKNYKKLISILFIALLLVVTVAGCKSGQEQPAGNTAFEVTATNEQELREYLSKDEAQLIHVSDSMTITKGFVVNGTKTLTGEAELKMDMGAELGQAILSVSSGSNLTLDGPVLECSYNARGIQVEADAQLTCLSGGVKHAGTYGILTYGTVNIEDINIEDSMYISICGQTGSEVYMNGGTILRSSYNHVYLVAGSYMKISGNTFMEGSYEQGIINYGTLDIHDGKFGETYGYMCDNYGVLNVEYKGDQEDSCIEVFDSRKSAFLSRAGSTTNISDVYIHDTSRQGISSLGGDTVISGCKLENTGGHALDIQRGEATITDVVVKDSKSSGLETRAGVTVSVTNLTVDGCANIGIACRGAEITASQVTICNTESYGMSCGDKDKVHGRLIVKDAKLSGTAKQGIYLYDNGRGEFENIEIADGASRGVIVKTTATAQITGNSTIKNMALGGVEVYGTLSADSLVVCDNDSANSGAGVYVGAGGNVTLSNGAIYNNKSAVRGGGVCVTDGTITIDGTKIYGNRAVNHGGGMYVQKTSLVSLKSGQITNNRSDSYGDGIYISSAESQVKVAEDFYLGGNDIKLDHEDAVVKFTGSTMKYHSEDDPVLLTPNYNAPEGTVLAICDSESNAKNIAVTSGDGSYYVVNNGKSFVIRYATADMDMTGADTVYVSNFTQLKNAVESTSSKRNIILTGDIEFTERLRLPGGVTINVQDDGTQRTMTRADGFTNSFFVTHYGTGLYLTGTEAGNLVIDGGYAASNDATKLQPLVRVAGSTVLNNVTLQNNGSLTGKNSVNGALLRNCYGDFQICNSVLTGGRAYSGGAVIVEKGEGYIEGTVIKGNQSLFGGAGIRVQGASSLQVVDSVFETNHSGSAGGGICASNAAQVTVTNTTFDRNTAAERGGALSAQDEGTVLVLVGTESEASVIKNNRSENGGAVYAVSKANLEVTGYLFEDNTAAEDENTAKTARGGAICIIGEATASIIDSAFYGNRADASGGAIVVDAAQADMISCALGKENAGNEAGDKAGAILVNAGGTVKMTAVEGGAFSTVEYNTADGVGGAFYVSEGSGLEIENYTVTGNQGSSGGAIYIHADATVVSNNNQFTENTAIANGTYGNGGAVFCEGSYADTGSSYYANEAKNGGAVIVMKGGTATLDGTAANAVMQGNISNVNGGSAVYVNTGANATVTGYLFEKNIGENGGSIQVHTGGNLALNNATFVGDNAAEIYVLGTIDLNCITNVSLIAAGADSAFVISGYEIGNVITFTPYTYKSGVAFQKAESLADETFRAACEAIAVIQVSEDVTWKIDENGKLFSVANVPPVATIATAGGVLKFSTLKDAVAYVNANGGTEAMEIVLLDNITVSETLVIEKNTSLVNASEEEITVSRGTQTAFDMFEVAAGATLMLGTNAADETGKLIIDSATNTAINGRIVQVKAEAGFVLAKNATLCNANSTSKNGAAVYTESVDTYIYGTIKNNATALNGGGVYVAANAGATIQGAVFSENQGGASAGGLYIASGATVTCENATFVGNKGLKGTTYANAGAVYCAGSFTDTNSTYRNNEAKNGGAVIVMSGGVANMTATDAVMQGNYIDTNYGGAIFVNGGGMATITGYTLDGNEKGGIQVQNNATATVENLVFAGAGNTITVNGSLTVQNLTNAQINQTKDGAVITLSGSAGTNVSIVPYSYEDGYVVLTNTAAELTSTIALIQPEGETVWSIDQSGKLVATVKEPAVATITVDGAEVEFTTAQAAIAYANENGGAEVTEIVLLDNVTLTETLEIQKNIAIVNAAGEEITISRGNGLTGDMFSVIEGAALHLGSNHAGAVIIDGASQAAIAGRTVTAAPGAAFTLNKNATLQNANSTAAGAAVHTSDADTIIYGTIQNNVTTNSAGAMYVYKNTGATISGATITNNQGKNGTGGVYIGAGAVVTCENTVFSYNRATTTANAGAIYVAGSFTDTNSSYIGNEAKNGGAIFATAGGEITLTGTDSRAVFKDNKATGAYAGAIYLNNSGKKGSSATIQGYTFENNIGTTDPNSAIYVKGYSSITLDAVIFQGKSAQKIYVAANGILNDETKTSDYTAEYPATTD